MASLVLLLLTALCYTPCLGDLPAGVAPPLAFTSVYPPGRVDTDELTDASGLGASRLHPGNFYTHNDRHGDAKLYVINSTGHLQARLYMQGVTSFDWEDLSVGPCTKGSSKHCIYVGDFGDGEDHAAVNWIYRIPEPANLTDQVITVFDSDKLQFSWDKQDADTLMVDPDANVYVISKHHNAHGEIVVMPTLAWGSNQRVDVTSSARVNLYSKHPGPQGGDISPDGTEILIKTKNHVYYWHTSGRDYLGVLQTEGVELPYEHEPQGEAICWGAGGWDYFTLSEGLHQALYHYARVRG